MRELNEISLKKFTETMKYLDELFTQSVEKYAPLLDQINTDCGVAGEMVVAIKELIYGKLDKHYEKAVEHYKVIIALWILLNDQEMLPELKH